MVAPSSNLPTSQIDVLIVGAGPAGYMAAAWLSKFQGLKVRMVEKRNSTIFAGQADGLMSRTLEILQSFDMADGLYKEAHHLIEVTFWSPGPDGKLRRHVRRPEPPPGISRFRMLGINQGYVERAFQDHLNVHGPPYVERGVMPESLTIDESAIEDPEAHPVKVVLRHLSDVEASTAQFGHSARNGLFRSTNLATTEEEDRPLQHKPVEGSQEIVLCKYVLGCDGAHSWVRRQLAIDMEGEQTDYVYGVLDIIPLTDFPDIRNGTAIHSASDGSVLVIPREKGLVRLYIQLADVERDARGYVDRQAITPRFMLQAAKKIMAPYSIDYEHIDWFTVYQIGQRVANRFTSFERVFIAGDACHTHSPKAGQGMNISMMDQYNLAWKIGLVCKGILQRSVLKTYEDERRKLAQDLIDMDQKLSRMFSGKPATDDGDDVGVSMEEFQTFYAKALHFGTHTSLQYGPSSIVTRTSNQADSTDGNDTTSHDIVSEQKLARGLPVGQRFNSFQVLNQADARPWQLQDLLRSDGRWHIVVFAGNVLNSGQKSRITWLGEYLQRPTTFMKTYTPSRSPRDSLFHVLTVHSSPRTSVELANFPSSLRPEHDYSSVYVDDESYHEGHGQAYENYGVDKETGCLVIVRPDQILSLVSELEDMAVVERFFAGCLIPQMIA